MGLLSPRDIVLYALRLAEVQYLCGGSKLQRMKPTHIAVVQEPTAFPRRACIAPLPKAVDNYFTENQDDDDDAVIAKLSAMCTCDVKCLTAALWHRAKLTTKVSNDGEDVVTVSLEEQDRAAREIWASDVNNAIGTCFRGAELITRTAEMSIEELGSREGNVREWDALRRDLATKMRIHLVNVHILGGWWEAFAEKDN